jgi:methylenetetrahydrofolate reductase (NADPH)
VAEPSGSGVEVDASMSGPQVSFEFFPPRTPEMETSLWRAVERLEGLAPRFVSVTYGAGGSTRERTHATVTRLRRETGLTPAAHLTCVGASRAEVDEVARRYAAAGIHHIVALRGDAPEGALSKDGRFVPHPDGYANAAELVAGLKRIADFEISVAAHPEGHPDSPSLEADIDNLARKVDAGATRAITQYFFDPALYLRLRDRLAARGLAIPLVPGILPVTNLKTLLKFSTACGASVPDWVVQRFAGLDDDPEVRPLVAASIAVEICRALEREGVDEFHFYTLNRAELTTAICRVLGVVEGRRA